MDTQTPTHQTAQIEAPSSFWGLLRQKQWRQSLQVLGSKIAQLPVIRFFLSSITARLTAVMALATAIMMVILIVSVTAHVSNGIFQKRLNIVLQAVSYTHLTLPTNGW